MGGKEAMRGFLCQAFASVLEALCDSSWDKIYVEYISKEDKVDIALESKSIILKSIQVKSTASSFSKNDVRNWLEALLKDDVGAKEIELFLLGQCTKDTLDFINSIEKLQNGEIDDKVNRCLANFDRKLISGKFISFKLYPHTILMLEKIARDSLHQYIWKKGIQSISYEAICFIASASVYDQFVSATSGAGMSRNRFEELLQKRIFLCVENAPQRRSIGIKSFTLHSDYLEAENYDILSLVDKFEKRNLKDGYDWNKDILTEVCDFLKVKTHLKEKYQIFLETHSSIAFATGKILGSKSGVDIYPFQKTADNGLVLWDQHSFNTEYSNWEFEITTIDPRKTDVALALGVSRDIESAVKEYISDANLPIGRLVNCRLQGEAATNYSVRNGDHAAFLSNTIYDVLKCRTLQERRGIMHIFSAAPNALMFYIGKNSSGFGKHILYEYDFEQRNTCTYSPSISFIC